jgi:hypothetical protein
MLRGDAARAVPCAGAGDHPGRVLWIVISGALLRAALIRFGGIRQARAVLEQAST